MHQYRRAHRAIIIAVATVGAACSDSPTSQTPRVNSAAVQFDGPMAKSWSVTGNPVLVNGQVDTNRDVVFTSPASWPQYSLQVPYVVSAERPARPGELHSYLYMQLHPSISHTGLYGPGDCAPVGPFNGCFFGHMRYEQPDYTIVEEVAPLPDSTTIEVLEISADRIRFRFSGRAQHGGKQISTSHVNASGEIDAARP
jgi:hypothetical protein